jgi:Tfp pilus assembly protein PilV
MSRRPRLQPVACRHASRHRGTRGFTLLSVLVSMLLTCLGLLGMAKAMLGVTSASTQNQNVTSIAQFSNAFYGVVQSNPGMLVASAFQGTFTSSNVTSAPAALQAWLAQVTGALPSAQVVIATGPDAGTGATCSATAGCTVTMSMQWSQVGAPGHAGANRAQTFYYQFGF